MRRVNAASMAIRLNKVVLRLHDSSWTLVSGFPEGEGVSRRFGLIIQGAVTSLAEFLFIPRAHSPSAMQPPGESMEVPSTPLCLNDIPSFRTQLWPMEPGQRCQCASSKGRYYEISCGSSRHCGKFEFPPWKNALRHPLSLS